MKGKGEKLKVQIVLMEKTRSMRGKSNMMEKIEDYCGTLQVTEAKEEKSFKGGNKRCR